MSQTITKLLAGILFALLFIRILSSRFNVPDVLYYLIGFIFLLTISFTYWKDRKVALSLFVLVLALVTGAMAILSIL